MSSLNPKPNIQTLRLYTEIYSRLGFEPPSERAFFPVFSSRPFRARPTSSPPWTTATTLPVSSSAPSKNVSNLPVKHLQKPRQHRNTRRNTRRLNTGERQEDIDFKLVQLIRLYWLSMVMTQNVTMTSWQTQYFKELRFNECKVFTRKCP